MPVGRVLGQRRRLAAFIGQIAQFDAGVRGDQQHHLVPDAARARGGDRDPTGIRACGVDDVAYLVGGAGPGGYGDIISPPGGHLFADGDVLILDTGCTFDGYYCDFDRNFAFGHIDDAARRAHEAVWNATQAGIDAARPGITAEDLWAAQNRVLEAAGAVSGNNVGRSGHGLGMHLTEPPSNMPGETTVLRPGMVMTVEPGMEYLPGKMIVHEENLVITEDGCELLTRRAAREMPVISA